VSSWTGAGAKRGTNFGRRKGRKKRVRSTKSEALRRVKFRKKWKGGHADQVRRMREDR